jgi:hypothetical protein
MAHPSNTDMPMRPESSRAEDIRAQRLALNIVHDLELN